MSGGQKSKNEANRGFTLIEIMVVVVVIAILASLIIMAGRAYLERAADGERATDIATITHQLERYYQNNPTATGLTYPPASTSAADMAKIIDDSEAIRAPDGTTSSIVMATSNAAQSPALNVYLYQPLAADNSLCTAAPCTHFKLYYRDEISGTVHVIDSMRQQ